MTLYEAVSVRKSVRKYKKDAIPEALFRQIERFLCSVSMLDEQIQYKINILDNIKGDMGVKGIFKVEVPYFLVFYSEEGSINDMNAGYILEQIVLYLTTKGLGSCYLGGTRIEAQEPGMRQVMAVGFGYPDILLYRDQALAKRLSMKELCIFKEEVEEPVRILLKAARLAPSSLNSQPWRFLVYRDRICVFACRDVLKMRVFHSMRNLNIGIALSHIMLAAEELWLDAKLIREETLKKKTYKNGDYMITVLLH